jgi:hypothetical protein
MITLGHYPIVQGILDEWKKSLLSTHRTSVAECTDEDLRQLIKTLEDNLDGMEERLNDLHKCSLKELLLLNGRWINQKVVRLQRLTRTVL